MNRSHNGSISSQAVASELEVGLLLPCTLIVYEADPTTTAVTAIAPLAVLNIVGLNPLLAQVAQEADRRLRTAMSQLALAPNAHDVIPAVLSS